MTVFHSVHWFFSLVQTALKKKLSPGMPLLHHVTLVLIIWHTIDFIFCEQSSTCFLLKTLENCFTMKSIMKIFAHIFFYGKPIIRYHKCLISSSFFLFNFIWIMCRLFSRTRMLKHCKHVIWSDTWQRVWPVQLPSDMP